MKRFKLILTLVLALVAFGAEAQNSFDQDILKMQKISGSDATVKLMYDQIVAQFKMQGKMADAPEGAWDRLYKEVFQPEVEELYKTLLPVYKKHFTHDDIKELIKFYESPIGQKLSKANPQIAQESMQASQMWGMGLMQKMEAFIAEN